MTQWGLDTLFNPGKRHMDDEKRRLQSTREEVGDSSGGRRIDLESGRVAINVARQPAAVEPTDDDEPATDGTELAAALEAEDVPAVALANDEAEIAPEVVDDAPADDVPIEAPTPEPVAAAAPTKRLSATDWSRRG